ncbi:MAG TPA: hypothetical protein PLW99_03625, partial [Candidatus Paceibacterota bacterium]|nr:hypothetical protein [Candidatus Paceibacterota bacterium]
FTAPRAGIENAILEELSVSAAAEAPHDARMRKKPAPRPPAQRTEPEPLPHKPFVPRDVSPHPVREQSRPEMPHRPREERKEFVPRPAQERTPALQVRPTVSVPAAKSADDLKAILRTMTAKNGAEKEQKKSAQQQSLKGALAEVLQRNPQKAETQKTETGAPEMRKPEPAAAQPPRETIPSAPTAPDKKPFEVSEDALRKVLKGDT